MTVILLATIYLNRQTMGSTPSNWRYTSNVTQLNQEIKGGFN